MTQALEILKLLLDYFDTPVLILLFMLGSMWGMVRVARRKGFYDFAVMLKDENGKESVTRLASLVALAFSSWFIMYDAIHNKQGDSTVLLIYLGVWSGAKVAERLVDALATKWSK
jgi:hypothetical protein